MNTGYIKATGIYYKTTIEKIKKSSDFLQPIYEAFTNSLESIKEKDTDVLLENITLDIHHTSNLTSKDTNNNDFKNITINDTGMGFNQYEFERFITLNDNKKGYSNNGSGRVQYIHFFKETKFITVCEDKNSRTGYTKKEFILSKSDRFISENAIVHIKSIEECNPETTYTKVEFNDLLDKKDEKKYSELSVDDLKSKLIEHYLDYFCENRSNLPTIYIRYIIDGIEIKKIEISSEDIPILDKEESFGINYSKFDTDGKEIIKSDKSELFKLKAYKISEDDLDKNSLKLSSKGQIVKGEISKKIKLSNLRDTDVINGMRYLFILSSSYIDSKDTDTRGELNISSFDEFSDLIKNESTLDLFEEILLDDIVSESNNKIENMYSEIKKELEKHYVELEKLKKMFLLNDETISSIKFNIQDTEDKILKKIYKADSEIIAKKDIEIKQQLDSLNELDTTSIDYQQQLNTRVSELVKIIPLQNRTTLTHYIARRKIVLDLFDKILNRELARQTNIGRNIDEKLLHNLIFQQSSENTEESDLWLVNEDFIYFKGTSENTLGDIEIDGNKIFKETLTDEEIEYRLKQQGDANLKRPDILLFPSEGKCILIEFKAPDVNVSEHLNQLNRYASLINNLSKSNYNFTTYYGYLIGENIDSDDIIDNDSDFRVAYNFDYIFRPYKRIIGKFDKKDGSLYTEVIKYTALLSRAKNRNKIFIDKLLKIKEQK